MTTVDTQAFPVRWDDPADAEHTWRYDPMHAPAPMTPLGFDLYMEPFLKGFGTLRLCQQNYYMFMTEAMEGGTPRFAAPPEAIRIGGKRFREEVVPEAKAFADHYRNTDFDVLPSEELAAEVDRLRDVRLRCGQLHTLSMMPWLMGMASLIETHHELTGGDDLAALRLVQGHGNKSMDANAALWRLGRLADSIPAVRDRIMSAEGERANDVLRALEAEPSAAPFLQGFREYLDEFGWRSSLFEMAEPSWFEEPDFPLGHLRSYMLATDYDPAKERAKLVAQREQAIAETLAPLSEDARARLRDVIDASAQVASLQEDHNFYIDQRVGVLPRRLLLAAGRRLVDAGMLAKPEDVFYLRHAELRAALLGRQDVTVIPEQRKAELAEWAKVTPPPFIGKAPKEGPDESDRFWGGTKLRSERPNELRGNGASAGVARGPARVLHGLNEGDRLQPGDVLVTRTTMPPWTPLFAIASAIVTETGGTLCHAAVVAREYGLPAVLNVEDATRLVQDGQLLEVDGSKGIVRML